MASLQASRTRYPCSEGSGRGPHFCAAGDDDELSQFTPSFLWLLRDFYLALEEDGRKVSPGEYLESALQPVKGAGRSVEAKNAVSSSSAVHKRSAALKQTALLDESSDYGDA